MREGKWQLSLDTIICCCEDSCEELLLSEPLLIIITLTEGTLLIFLQSRGGWNPQALILVLSQVPDLTRHCCEL